MSTSCSIGMTLPNGTIEYIRCNWDGMPDVTGKLLFEHYSDPDKVQALLNLGDLSYLEKEVEPPKGCAHTFEHPAPDTTVAYVRDRGETEAMNKARVAINEATFRDQTIGEGACHAYLFMPKDGTWFCREYDGNLRKWKVITTLASCLAVS